MNKRNKTARLGLLLALVMVLVAGLAILVLNLTYTRLIGRQAEEALLREAQAFSNPGEQGPAGFLAIPVHTFQASADLLPPEGAPQSSELERALLLALREAGKTGEPVRVTGEGREMYALALPREGGRTAVLYANVAPLKAFLNRLSLVFLGVLLLAGLPAVLLGLRLGRAVEDTQWKLQRFFANASHELQTPLTVIRGHAEGISKGLSAEPARAADGILSASDRMARLVDELLFLSRVDAGAMELQKQPFSIRDLLETCARDLAPQAALRDVDLVTGIPEDLPMLTGDQANLERAVRNVLNNAIRYAEKQVTLFAYVLGGKLVIKIKDDGQGIAKKDLPHILDRFHGAAGQTGVGLSLAREIAQLHGGSLQAENNGGAQFRFTLPL